MRPDCDIAVVGSGFGGSLMAMIAQRLGYRTMLLERGRHPRFAIGESASPLAGILIEQLADRYGLPRARPLSAFGTWQRTYPSIACGLKRGFTYFRHERGAAYRSAADRSNQLLVAASPNDELSDTHWLRSDVDHFLVGEAIAAGAEYVDELRLEAFEPHDRYVRLRGRRRDVPVTIGARLVVDASGPHGFISRALNVRNVGFDDYPPTQALFSHFTGVARCGDMPEFVAPHEGAPYGHFVAPHARAPYGQPAAPLEGVPDGRHAAPLEGVPYAVDDAALHHVFDGGWMWVLRFGNGVISAGIAVTDDLAAELRLADGEPAWRRFLSLYPSVAAQFANAAPTREFTWMPRMSWRVEQASGPGWVMLPSAAGFVDPLFSTGIPLTLLGIERLARRLETGTIPDSRSHIHDPSDYADLTLADVDHTARFVAGCYAAFPRFEQFAAYSMFYFAAASFAEMSRRLGLQPPGARFLAADRPAFADALVRLSPQVRPFDAGYAAEVARAIEPVNIAGLCDAARRNWYPVDSKDTVRGAAKLGVTEEQAALVCV